MPSGTGVAAAAAVTQRVQSALAQDPKVEIVERNYLYYQLG